MVNSIQKIVVDDEAKMALKEAYKFIKKDSLKNAEKVRIGILKSIEELLKIRIDIRLTNTDTIKIFPIGLMKYSNTE